MNQSKSGKKPISSKPKLSPFNQPDFFKNKMSINADIKNEIDSKGLECRFIDYRKYIDNGNEHNKGWKVYRRPKDSIVATDEFMSGSNPDGLIRRGSTVLAVRPKEYGERHREWLAEKANVYKRFGKNKRAELEKHARDNGLDTQIDDQFDEEDQEN